MLGRAPKTVLSTIAGLDDGRAWAMRVAMASNCREALDSLIGLDHPTAWELREACLELWPACVVKSLGVLVNGARGKELLHRALLAVPGQHLAAEAGGGRRRPAATSTRL